MQELCGNNRIGRSEIEHRRGIKIRRREDLRNKNIETKFEGRILWKTRRIRERSLRYN